MEELITRFGEERIKELKDTFAPKKLHVIQVEDKFAILRPIGAKELSEFSMIVSDKNKGLDEATRYLLTTLWLDGDDCIKDDEDYMMSAMLQVQDLIELKKSTSYTI